MDTITCPWCNDETDADLYTVFDNEDEDVTCEKCFGIFTVSKIVEYEVFGVTAPPEEKPVYDIEGQLFLF